MVVQNLAYLLLILTVLDCHHDVILNNIITGSNSDDDKTIQNCVQQIIDNNHDKNTIHFINTNLQLNIDLIRYKIIDKKMVIKKETFFIVDFYVIGIWAPINEAIFDWLFKMDTFNPRAKFIVLVDDLQAFNAQKLFQTMQKYFVDRVVVIDLATGDIIRHQPYIYENAMGQNPVVFKKVADCDGNLAINLFPSNYSGKMWRNTTIKVGLHSLPPYSYQRNDQPEGIEYHILEILMQKLEFCVEVIRRGFPDWGEMLEKRQYNHFVAELRSKKPNAFQSVLGGFNFEISLYASRHFDITTSIMEDHVYITVPTSPPIPHWKLLFTIFHPTVWLILLSCLLILPVIYWLIGLNNSILFVWELLFEIATPNLDRKYKKLHLRVLIIICILTFYIMSTIFKTSMIRILSGSAPSNEINSVQDIVDRNLQIYAFTYFKAYLQSNGHSTDDQLLEKRIVLCAIDMSCLNATAYQKTSGTTILHRTYDYYLAKLYIDAKGQPLLHRIDNSLKHIHIALFFTKGFPLYPQINLIVSHLLANGIIQHFTDRTTYLTKKLLTQKKLPYSNNLNFDKLYFVFCIWLVGVVVGIVAFIFEVCSKT